MPVTDEQVKNALMAFYASGDLHEATREDIQVGMKRAMKAAAPYLQIPWELPSDKEVRSFLSDATNASNGKSIEHCLRQFVYRRNTTLCPEPIDVRRLKVLRIIGDATLSARPAEPINVSLLVDDILAVFDEDEADTMLRQGLPRISEAK